MMVVVPSVGEMVVSEELSCGEVAGAPKLMPFLFSFFLFCFHQKENFSVGILVLETKTQNKFVSVSGIWQKNWRRMQNFA